MTLELRTNIGNEDHPEDIPYEFRLSTYEYDIPPELIAQEPAAIRDESRLMVINRRNSSIDHRLFRDLPIFLRESDVLVLNQTSVIPGLLKGHKSTGGSVELLVLNPGIPMKTDSARDETLRECLVKTSKPLKAGSPILLDDHTLLVTQHPLAPGRALIRFPCPENEFLRFLKNYGLTPLPPYIKSGANTTVQHDQRYQTIYSKAPGSVAAPTAGLHFTNELLSRIKEMGVSVVMITLHVGIGTFMPMRTPDIRNHRMETELFEVPEQAAASINSAIRSNRRVIAVGSTSMRTLESAAIDDETVIYGSQSTDLFIKPGYRFKIPDAMLTNFHLPHSTLLPLVSAFSSIPMIKECYAEAIKHRYRFFSYGDSSLFI